MAGTVALGGRQDHKDGYIRKESGQSLLGSVGLLLVTTVSLSRSMVRLDDNWRAPALALIPTQPAGCHHRNVRDRSRKSDRRG
jgi:hypothetical protein